MKERNLDKILTNFYRDGYVEDDRLTRDKMHYIEYITTTNYINKYLKKGYRILEVGAGTGAYSLHYASLGYQVDAVELVKANVDILNSKVTSDMNIKAKVGNALDLHMYEDNKFDITLLLGPMYHLFDKDEEQQALKEAIRVTKKDGIIITAYILYDLTMLTWGIQNKNLYNNYGIDKMVNIDYKPNNKEEYTFNMRYYEDVKKITDNLNIETIKYVATDGIGRVIRNNIEEMSEEEYKHYINYHLSICEREDLIGYSGHIIGIYKKN